ASRSSAFRKVRWAAATPKFWRDMKRKQCARRCSSRTTTSSSNAIPEKKTPVLRPGIAQIETRLSLPKLQWVKFGAFQIEPESLDRMLLKACRSIVRGGGSRQA